MRRSYKHANGLHMLFNKTCIAHNQTSKREFGQDLDFFTKSN